MADQPILQATKITKTFPGVLALDGVSFDLGEARQCGGARVA